MSFGVVLLLVGMEGATALKVFCRRTFAVQVGLGGSFSGAFAKQNLLRAHTGGAVFANEPLGTALTCSFTREYLANALGSTTGARR